MNRIFYTHLRRTTWVARAFDQERFLSEIFGLLNIDFEQGKGERSGVSDVVTSIKQSIVMELDVSAISSNHRATSDAPILKQSNFKVGEIISRFEKKGFYLKGLKFLNVDRAYSHCHVCRRPRFLAELDEVLTRELAEDGYSWYPDRPSMWTKEQFEADKELYGPNDGKATKVTEQKESNMKSKENIKKKSGGRPPSCRRRLLMVKWPVIDHQCRIGANVKAMFTAIGVGYSSSLPSAAALNWVLKDGLGRLSRCIYTASLPSAFDTNLKIIEFVKLGGKKRNDPGIPALAAGCVCVFVGFKIISFACVAQL
ncbi:hypothetical protein P8452_52198 [Trifolium repens]|nr:hypothetical protein P8452_52198 [Trifolium repens]